MFSTCYTRGVLSLYLLPVHSNPLQLPLAVSSHSNIQRTISSKFKLLPPEPVLKLPSLGLQMVAIRSRVVLKHIISHSTYTNFLLFPTAASETGIVPACGSTTEPPCIVNRSTMQLIKRMIFQTFSGVSLCFPSWAF